MAFRNYDDGPCANCTNSVCDTDRVEPEEINAASYVSRPTRREKDEYEEMLSWAYESIV